jgi:hypothetical protein
MACTPRVGVDANDLVTLVEGVDSPLGLPGDHGEEENA